MARAEALVEVELGPGTDPTDPDGRVAGRSDRDIAGPCEAEQRSKQQEHPFALAVWPLRRLALIPGHFGVKL